MYSRGCLLLLCNKLRGVYQLITSDDNGEEGVQNGLKIDYIIVEQPLRKYFETIYTHIATCNGKASILNQY